MGLIAAGYIGVQFGGVIVFLFSLAISGTAPVPHNQELMDAAWKRK